MRISGRVVAMIAVLASAAPVQAQPYHFEDSLRGSTSGNASCGSFGPDGWTVTGASDRIWYALPRLESGAAEFTLANVTLTSLPLGDQEIFAMYEDGYGIGEPIHYAPEFRSNDYKILVRIYGTPEPARAGYMKLMWGICPEGAPGYDDGSGCACASFFEEPFGDPGAWTGTPVRMRVEWGGGSTRLLRDGAEVVSVDWSGSGLAFGPSDLHMMLGSPRNDGGLSSMPIGAVFSDLVVDGTEGPLATCPSAPDAGTPPDCDSREVATADATAASWQPGVYSDASDLNVEGDGAAPTGIVYLRFAPVGGAVTRATLRMRVASVASSGGGSGQVCRVDGTFDEATLTWSTRPAVSTACSGGAHTVAIDDVVTWDVSSLIPPAGDVWLAIVSTDGDGAHYLSREAGGCAEGPQLSVELAPVVDGGALDAGTVGPRDAGAHIEMDGSTASRDAALVTDSGGSGRPNGVGGCGCRATPLRSTRGFLALAIALAFAAARARRTR